MAAAVVTESEVSGSFSKIGENPSDKDFVGKCETGRGREREREIRELCTKER